MRLHVDTTAHCAVLLADISRRMFVQHLQSITHQLYTSDGDAAFTLDIFKELASK